MTDTYKEMIVAAILDAGTNTNGDGNGGGDPVRIAGNGDADTPRWQPVDIGPAWRGDKPRPVHDVLSRSDGTGLLPPGINWIHGDSGDGKTWVTLIAHAEEARRGRTSIFVTNEDANEDEVVGRLQHLGLTFEQAVKVLVFVVDDAMAPQLNVLGSLIEQHDVRLLTLDSIGGAFAVEGVDEDRDAQVGSWAAATLKPLTKAFPRLSCNVVDHSTKAKDNPLYPSGSKRKRALVTARNFLLEVMSPFGRDRAGFVRLITAKDRTGLWVRGELAAEIRMDATVHPYAVTIDPPPHGAKFRTRQRSTAERIDEVLTKASAPMERHHVARIVNEPGYRQHDENEVAVRTVENVLAKLEQAGKITVTLTTDSGEKGVRLYGKPVPEPELGT
jgi:hypothetical protein